ncbi:hypothetical protein QTI17_31975, partial [Variovorax sp. J31P179]|uniref:hypothetical protein n=1 Tax=Variovorax sp. J31P179 TaxID=3053508 RepID=UPI0025771CA5
KRPAGRPHGATLTEIATHRVVMSSDPTTSFIDQHLPRLTPDVVTQRRQSIRRRHDTGATPTMSKFDELPQPEES